MSSPRGIGILAVGLLVAAGVPASRAAEVEKYYHLDAVGSVRAITDRSGNLLERFDYHPYGEDSVAPATNNTRRFTGKERDPETAIVGGLDYFGARYYFGRVARFTSVDPVYNWRENILDPQRWNRYCYGRNNPLRYVDPDGRDSKDAERAAQAAAIAAGAAMARDASVRGQYVETVGRLSPTDTAGRTAAKIAARDASTPVGEALAEAMRPIAGEAGRFAGTASRTNVGVNRAMVGAGAVGKGLLVVGVGISVANVAMAPEGETDRVASQEVGAWTGALSFGAAGAKGGAVLGTAIGGPPGGAVGAVVGGLGGAIGGAFAGAQAGSNVYEAARNQ
jgi:RHS repeat-associated protein